MNAVLAPLDSIGQAIRDARVAQKLSMRDVEARTKALEAANPLLYAFSSRQQVSSLEINGIEKFESLPHRALRGMLVAIFGDVAAFVGATGIDPNLSSLTHYMSRVLWTEGEVADPQRLTTDFNQPTFDVFDPRVVFGVQVKDDTLAPRLFAGQVVGMRPTAIAQPGQLCVLQYGGRLLLAYALPADDRFTRLNDTVLKLSKHAGDSVLGVAVESALHVPERVVRGERREAS